MPLGVTNFVQKLGAKLYFNPLIPLRKFEHVVDREHDKRKLKYGVISLDDAIDDLT
jgi:hypothetical protein